MSWEDWEEQGSGSGVWMGVNFKVPSRPRADMLGRLAPGQKPEVRKVRPEPSPWR